MHIRILLLGLCLCAAGAVSAQTTNSPANPRALSLGECIDLALSRNLDLQIEHLTAEMSSDLLSSAYGVYVPVFSFTARHDYVSQPSTIDPKKAGQDFPYKLNTDTLRPELSGAIPFGLSYDFNAIAANQDMRTDFNSNSNTAALFPPAGIRQT